MSDMTDKEIDELVAKKVQEMSPELAKRLDTPLDTSNLLSGHEFMQEGRVLRCVDDPSLTAVLPLGVHLVGEKGAYRLEKVF